ncbi:MAG: alpha/beta hydrolase, partial [Planctomycetes bacterium]|nr:alpha/beta hydrolase [Planctomycetota bacterium]
MKRLACSLVMILVMMAVTSEWLQAAQRNLERQVRRMKNFLQIPSDDAVRKRLPKGLEFIPNIAYREGNSRAWRLDLVMPKDQEGPPRPALVFVHGGGWRSGDKRRGYFLHGAIEYAQKGYVCITVNYRLSDEAPFPACVEDVKCAVRWLRAHAKKYHVDPNRIGGYGNSAGAHLVAMLGLVPPEAGLEGDGPYQDQSSRLQAVCASAIPTDFSDW